MRYSPALCLAAALSIAVMAGHAQSVDTLTGKLAGFPTRLFSKIQSESANLNQQINSQTEKYLARMARREQQMQKKLAALDSNAARTLFANAQQQYKALATQVRADTGNRKNGLSGQYVPYVDTLQGAIAFLQQHPQLMSKSNVVAAPGIAIPSVAGISPEIQAKMQGAASQFQALNAKMQDADIIKAYVQSRQQQISQYMAQHTVMVGVLGKSLASMQQEQYYYSQRVQQYKEMLSDPGALAQQALAMLAKLPAFQNFMTSHSQLGTLFHVPGSYGGAQAVNGLQTKEQVAGIVQSHISAAGPAGATALQGNLQSAQSQLDGFKDKLSKYGLGSANAPMPAFTPNTEKTKTFLRRIQFGFDFQTTHNSYYYPNLLSFGLSVGYKLGHSNVVGIGASYELGTGNGIRNIAFTSQGLGLRSFLRIKIKGSFSATAGFEYNYTTPFSSYQDLKQIQYWTRSGLIGVTKEIPTKSKVLKQTTVSLLWDAMSYYQSPATQPFLFRIGYNFN
jgi:hypothetical protein